MFPELTEQDLVDLGAVQVEAEQQVLGACLLNNKLVPLLESSCEVLDFYDPLHQRIAERMFAKHAAGRPITPLTMKAAMVNDAGLKQVGGYHYFIGLAQGCSGVVHVADLGRTIAETRMRREAVSALYDAAELLADAQPLEEAIAGVAVIADAEADRLDRLRGTSDAAAIGMRVIGEVSKGKPEEFGARTGIGALDALIGGLYPKKLLIAGGRPGMGKSILGTTLSLNTASQGFEPHYYSLEMSADELVARMLTDLDYNYAVDQNLKPLEYTEIERRMLNGNPIPRLLRANEHLDSLGIKIHDLNHAPASLIGRMLRAAVSRAKKPVVAIVDHLTIIDPEPTRSRDPVRAVDRVTFITRLFKRLAKELEIPIVLLSQLNRELEGREDKRPIMADFRDSGSIEQDADILIGVNRPEQYVWREKPKPNRTSEQWDAWLNKLATSENLLQLGILKNRMGKIGDVECFIDAGSSAIRATNPAKTAVPAQAELGNMTPADWHAMREGF